jgi:hypothetical protein
MNTFQVPFQQLPKVRQINVTPNNYILFFVDQREADNKKNLHQAAQTLYEHMEIVDESRNLISKGKIITWEEYKKLHEKREA